MRDIIEELKERQYHLNQIVEKIKTYMVHAPEGYMKISKRGQQVVHYHMIKNKEKPRKEEGRYLSHKNEKDQKYMRELAKKSYYRNILPVLEFEIKTLGYMIQNYHPEEKYQVYDKMSDERKKFVATEFLRPEEIVKTWEEQKSSPNTKYPEGLKFETNSGEMVRSKSEMIIAGLLERSNEYCAYKYEEALYLSKSGFYIYPDFTIMKRSTAKRYYWEHCGKMDDPQYVNMFIDKINKYILEGIYPGEQLILTFESAEKPLDVAVVRKIIRHYFLDEE